MRLKSLSLILFASLLSLMSSESNASDGSDDGADNPLVRKMKRDVRPWHEKIKRGILRKVYGPLPEDTHRALEEDLEKYLNDHILVINKQNKSDVALRTAGACVGLLATVAASRAYSFYAGQFFDVAVRSEGDKIFLSLSGIHFAPAYMAQLSERFYKFKREDFPIEYLPQAYSNLVGRTLRGAFHIAAILEASVPWSFFYFITEPTHDLTSVILYGIPYGLSLIDQFEDVYGGNFKTWLNEILTPLEDSALIRDTKRVSRQRIVTFRQILRQLEPEELATLHDVFTGTASGIGEPKAVQLRRKLQFIIGASIENGEGLKKLLKEQRESSINASKLSPDVSRSRDDSLKDMDKKKKRESTVTSADLQKSISELRKQHSDLVEKQEKLKQRLAELEGKNDTSSQRELQTFVNDPSLINTPTSDDYSEPPIKDLRTTEGKLKKAVKKVTQQNLKLNKQIIELIKTNETFKKNFPEIIEFINHESSKIEHLTQENAMLKKENEEKTKRLERLNDDLETRDAVPPITYREQLASDLAEALMWTSMYTQALVTSASTDYLSNVLGVQNPSEREEIRVFFTSIYMVLRRYAEIRMHNSNILSVLRGLPPENDLSYPVGRRIISSYSLGTAVFANIAPYEFAKIVLGDLPAAIATPFLTTYAGMQTSYLWGFFNTNYNRVFNGITSLLGKCCPGSYFKRNEQIKDLCYMTQMFEKFDSVASLETSKKIYKEFSTVPKVDPNNNNQ